MVFSVAQCLNSLSSGVKSGDFLHLSLSFITVRTCFDEILNDILSAMILAVKEISFQIFYGVLRIWLNMYPWF